MYCKQCGHLVGDNDRFCSNCGERIVGSVAPSLFEKESSDTSVTNVENKAFVGGSVPGTFSDEVEAKPKRVYKRENFSWDLEGYPDTEVKKTDEVDFNWDSVMEEKMRLNSRAAFVNEEVKDKEPESFTDLSPFTGSENVQPEKEPEKENLEEFLFKDKSLTMPAKNDAQTADEEKVDKFYTFNKKNEEFQALLDREYEKLKMSRGEGFRSEDTSMDAPVTKMTFAGNLADRLSKLEESNQAKANLKAEEAVADEEESFEEPEIQTPVTPIEEAAETVPESEMGKKAEPEFSSSGEEVVSVAQPALLPVTESFDAEAETEAVNEATEKTAAEEAEEEEKPCSIIGAAEPEKKLTLDDIFNGAEDENDDAVEKKSRKERSGKGRKVNILVKILFYLILILAIAALGFKYFAKDSIVTKKMDAGYDYIISKLTGNDTGKPEMKVDDTGSAKTIENWIADAKSLNEYIGTVIPNQELKFVNEKDYGFKEVADAKPFENASWYTIKNNGIEKNVYYGGGIVETLVKYYSDEAGNYESGNTLDKLEIGEIRTGDFGFFVLVKTGKTENGQNVTTTETVKIVVGDKEMSVQEVKPFEGGDL